MSPETRIRAARALIPIGLVIGVVAAVIGAWWTVGAMALLIVGQVLNARTSRRKLAGRPPSRFFG
jgi:hypothetical protein